MNPTSTKEPETKQQESPQEALEREILESLDLNNWPKGPDLERMYRRLTKEVGDAVSNETKAIAHLRNEIFPRLQAEFSDLPRPVFGRFSLDMLQEAHRSILFNGSVEAVNGTLASHEALPLSVSQIGICMVSYQGEMGTYTHRLFKKNLSIRGEEPLEEAVDWIEHKQHLEKGRGEHQATELARRGLKTYAERNVLVRAGTLKDSWRMGNGNPFPLEMFSDYWIGSKKLRGEALALLRELVAHERFVFVPAQTRRLAWLTLGNALRPLEYLLLGPIKKEFENQVQHRYRMNNPELGDFIETCGDQVVMGLFRASELAPARLFFAHRDHADMAALIATADGMLHAHRGYPMLLDLAGSICKATFNPQSFQSLIEQSYARAGEPFRYI